MSDLGRDYDIVCLAARYGVLTPVAIAVSLFKGLSDKAAERMTTRLLSAHRLQSLPLVGRKVYYTLTGSAAKDLGLSPDRFAIPMGAQALTTNFAIMAF